ncbi:MAG: hypothetical protein KatS3mg104_1840 [Phycisphaerae bacterium]|jgi:hypothetical protein|nr:MAG: hypothetical protein KatS3mg104_1840 [Phycisphaerae bacterium]
MQHDRDKWLDVALKEWQGVCRAIETGRQILLLRKGGIHETEGRFEVEYREFLLFPTWLHQNPKWVKEADRHLFQRRDQEPNEIEIRSFVRVTDIVRIRTRAQMDVIDDTHIYLPPLIDMRFNYKPHNPLYLLLVRGYRLTDPVRVANLPHYAGCKSWVPLEIKIPIGSPAAVLSDDDFERSRQRLLEKVRGVRVENDPMT